MGSIFVTFTTLIIYSGSKELTLLGKHICSIVVNKLSDKSLLNAAWKYMDLKNESEKAYITMCMYGKLSYKMTDW